MRESQNEAIRMRIERIRSVAVVVSDEKKAKEWYRDRLGFEVQDDMEHWVVVGPPVRRQVSTCAKARRLNPGIPESCSTLTMWKPRIKN